MAHVFRRPWQEWRRGKPKSTFNIPPPSPPAQNVDIAAHGQRRYVAYGGWETKRYVFRRPWGPYGGVRLVGVAYPASTAEVTNDNAAKWWRQASEPVRFPRKLPAALHPHFGYLQAATQNAPTNTFGEEIHVSKYFPPLSEPVRRRPGIGWLLAGQQQAQIRPDWPDIRIPWFAPLHEPIRQKPGIGHVLRSQQQFDIRPYWPDIRIGWFMALPEPVRQHPDRQRRIITALQTFEYRADIYPLDVRIAWFVNTNLPPAMFIKRGLNPTLHLHYASDPAPVPGRPWAKGYTIV